MDSFNINPQPPESAPPLVPVSSQANSGDSLVSPPSIPSPVKVSNEMPASIAPPHDPVLTSTDGSAQSIQSTPLESPPAAPTMDFSALDQTVSPSNSIPPTVAPPLLETPKSHLETSNATTDQGGLSATLDSSYLAPEASEPSDILEPTPPSPLVVPEAPIMEKVDTNFRDEPEMQSVAARKKAEDQSYSMAEELAEKFTDKDLPSELTERVKSTLKRIDLLESTNANFEMVDALAHWLETVLELPWSGTTADNLSIEEAQKIMNDGHYGMHEIKDKILDYIAVQKLTNGNAKGMVLCFVGPAGVGKTTITKIIAESLGRQYERISLAALGDMSQIRGRNRFAKEAEPSMFVKAMARAGVMNPVICLDEIDKIGGEGLLGGEAMAAFLEILDPAQNYAFSDHYLDYPYDLSQVLFIATANKLLGADNPVVNRMEMISLPDYTKDDKVQITKLFVIPQKLKENGLSTNGVDVVFKDDIWDRLLGPYTWDSGMRTTQHNIDIICKKIARKVVQTGIKQFEVNAGNLREFIMV